MAGSPDYQITHEEFNLDGHDDNSATFSNVSGDIFDAVVATGYGQEHFMQDFEGENKETTVPITVQMNVCEFNLEHGGESASCNETHNVTVIVHNMPEDNGRADPPDDGGDTEDEARVTGSAEIGGYIVFGGDESDDNDP